MTQTYVDSNAVHIAAGAPGINSTGANFVRVVVLDSALGPTDSLGNSWEVEHREATTGLGLFAIWKPVVEPPIVGINHFFDIVGGGNPDAIAVIAINTTVDMVVDHIVDCAPVVGAVTSLTIGPITPSDPVGLILSCGLVNADPTGTTTDFTLDSPFGLAVCSDAVAGAYFGAILGYGLNLGTVQNPVWRWTNPAGTAGFHISYKIAPSTPATLETLDGPPTGFVGYASADFIVGADGDMSAVTTTPTTSGTGAFIPSSLVGPGTFKYISLTAETCNINCTNDGGLTPPSNISFTSTVGVSGSTANGGRMPGILREATAGQGFVIGPFLDATGTPVVDLAIIASDVKIILADGTLTTKSSGGLTYAANGDYKGVWSDADTVQVGSLNVSVNKTGAGIVVDRYMVKAAGAFDKNDADDAPGPASADDVGLLFVGNAASASATGVVISGTWPSGDLRDALLIVTGATQGYQQRRRIRNNVNTAGSQAITVDTWDVTPSGPPIRCRILGTIPQDDPLLSTTDYETGTAGGNIQDAAAGGGGGGAEGGIST